MMSIRFAGLRRLHVRYWHLADFDADTENVVRGGKADIPDPRCNVR